MIQDIFADGLFRLKNSLNIVTNATISDKNFIEKEIRKWKFSIERSDMIIGERYYLGLQDILKKERQAIGEDGKLVKVDNLPNHKILDNQYKKMIDQKVNYLLGKPLTIQAENKNYQDILNTIFDEEFQIHFIKLGRNAYNCGKAWLQPYYNEIGEFKFKCVRPYELKVNWKDDDHLQIDYAIRVYSVVLNNGITETNQEKVEIFTDNGIDYFDLTVGGNLIPTEPYHTNYFKIGDEMYNWQNIPLVCFKYHNNEEPLIKGIKSIQDGINQMESAFQDNIEEDARNTIMVLINYDGENLGEFRRNLATYGAVKIKSDLMGAGDVKTLQVQVNSENYKTILKLFKEALIENAMGYDAKDDRLNGSPNQMNIQSMYNDIDMDANTTESEFQLSLKKLLWFVNVHLKNTGVGDFFNEKVNFIFNRDTITNETEVISNCIKLNGILSKDTILAQIPWVKDIQQEKELLAKEKEEEYNPFGNNEVKANGEQSILGKSVQDTGE